MSKGDVLGSATVPGPPVPKARPRTVRDKVTGESRTFTPPRTKAYEAMIAQMWLGKKWYEGPVSVVLDVHEGRGHPADIDNYCKISLDALNGIAVVDDRQVVHIDATLTRDCANPSLTVIFLEH